MKIKNITDIDGFFKVIDSCQGKVELITGEGDRLNLKSKLCQYVSLTSILKTDVEIPELELVAYEPEDTEKIIMNIAPITIARPNVANGPKLDAHITIDAIVNPIPSMPATPKPGISASISSSSKLNITHNKNGKFAAIQSKTYTPSAIFNYITLFIKFL